jgi:hypothetical protein
MIRTLRARHPTPKYIPTPFLKRLWTDWKVPTYKTRYTLSEGDDTSTTETTSRRRGRGNAHNEFDAGLSQEQARLSRQSAATVDRNTSVRSVMTLPPYRHKASEEEQVLGREGERDGIDVVVEMPTAEDEEAMREDEMDALYQIRLARRRQIREREQRRQERRTARERNDAVALQEIRDRTRAAATNNSDEIDDLRAEHERLKTNRQRAVSSVSYADLGVARHDGTRIRANSTESSERVGLLSDAASIAQSTRPASSLLHRRDRSASSVLSIDTFHSSAERSRSRASSGANTPRRQSQGHTPRAGSSPELIDAAEADLGDGADLPPHSPPGYDDVSLDEVATLPSRAASPYPEPPPGYPGPTETRNHRLSAQMADLAAEATSEDERAAAAKRVSRGVGGVPQLPSLRLARLPQIVIEPSTAVPRDNHSRFDERL